MSSFSPEIVAVLAACRENEQDINAALSGALETTLTIGVPDDGAAFDRDALPESLAAGPGLILAMQMGGQAGLLLLSESTGLLPTWYAAPDVSQVSKLQTLAQELSILLLPQELMCDAFPTGRVEDLADAVVRVVAAEDAQHLQIGLTADAASGTLHMIWPAEDVESLLAADEPAPEDAATDAEDAAADETVADPPVARLSTDGEQAPALAEALHGLPGYARSLLKIQVPVTVTLAKTQQKVGQIVDLGPGSIIQFEKPCEDMLELEVGDRRVALGEAVKVGDKFGLRLTEVVMPDERFQAVTKQ